METQKIPSSQNNIEKTEQSWRYHSPWLQTKLQSYSNQNSMLLLTDSVWPHRRPPTRLLCPWDSPGKNTGVDCHFLLQCMKVKSESEVSWSCLTLSDLMDCSLPGSSVHGIFQARVLEQGAIAWYGIKTDTKINGIGWTVQK